MTLTEVMIAVSIMTGLSSNQFTMVRSAGAKTTCLQQLKAIATGLQLYTMTNGKYPDAVFYPKGDPKKDPKSILVLLKGNVNPRAFVCPSAPPALKQKGLTFVWNTKASGKSVGSIPGNTWLLIEINAVDPSKPAPHSGKYHIVCANGSVKEVDKIPDDLRETLKKLKKKEKAE